MRTSIVLLAASFVLVGIPFAAADETDPDCEPGQMGIGYRTTSFVWDTYYAETAGTPLSTIRVCEGEHWDGQDTAQPGQYPSCTGTLNAAPDDFFFGLCLGPDPNTMVGDDPQNPLGVRVSERFGGPSDWEVYVGTNIALVGRATVYASDDTAAVYLRDNTPGNVLATVVSAARITQGYVDEGDCSQSVYQHGALNPPSQCGRDNTAITVEHGLLP